MRETWEEASIDLTPYYFVEKFSQPLQNESGYFTTFVLQFPQIPDWDIEIDYESEDWGWFTLQQMESINLHPGMYYAMAKLGM